MFSLFINFEVKEKRMWLKSRLFKKSTYILICKSHIELFYWLFRGYHGVFEIPQSIVIQRHSALLNLLLSSMSPILTPPIILVTVWKYTTTLEKHFLSLILSF